MPTGARTRRLTDDPADDFAPAWSPDGTKVAFARDHDGVNFEIHVINADGTAPSAAHRPHQR